MSRPSTTTELEDWPTLFTEEALCEIIPRENEEFGFPAPLIRCDNRRMMRDRVLSLGKANIFEKPGYRHCLSGLVWRREDNGSFSAETSYVVVNTSQEGESTIYQTGLYRDRIARTYEGLRFTAKCCIYDMLRVQTLLAFPVDPGPMRVFAVLTPRLGVIQMSAPAGLSPEADGPLSATTASFQRSVAASAQLGQADLAPAGDASFRYDP